MCIPYFVGQLYYLSFSFLDFDVRSMPFDHLFPVNVDWQGLTSFIMSLVFRLSMMLSIVSGSVVRKNDPLISSDLNNSTSAFAIGCFELLHCLFNFVIDVFLEIISVLIPKVGQLLMIISSVHLD